MKKELQEKLFLAYPEIFRQKDLDKTVVLETVPLIEALNKPTRGSQGFFIT